MKMIHKPSQPVQLPSRVTLDTDQSTSFLFRQTPFHNRFLAYNTWPSVWFSGTALHYPIVPSCNRYLSHHSWAVAVLLGGISRRSASFRSGLARRFDVETKDDSSLYLLPNPSILSRFFSVSQGSALSSYRPVKAGVLQGSILAPLLYSVYTGAIPLHPHTAISTFADDRGILSKNPDPILTSCYLKDRLNSLQTWFCE